MPKLNDVYTTREAAEYLGITPNALLLRIHRGWVKPDRTHEAGKYRSYLFTRATLDRIKAGPKRPPRTREHAEKIGAALRGRKRPPEVVEKIRASLAARKTVPGAGCRVPGEEDPSNPALGPRHPAPSLLAGEDANGRAEGDQADQETGQREREGDLQAHQDEKDREQKLADAEVSGHRRTSGGAGNWFR